MKLHQHDAQADIQYLSRLAPASQCPILDKSVDNSPRSEYHAPRLGVTKAVCWLRPALNWRGQAYWVGVLAPWVLVGWWRQEWLILKALFSKKAAEIWNKNMFWYSMWRNFHPHSFRIVYILLLTSLCLISLLIILRPYRE